MSNHMEAVEQSIIELVKQYEDTPYYFVSESDVKCFIYHLLISKEPFKGSHLTKEGKVTSLIHTEYPSLLRFNVDLVVLNPQLISDFRLRRQKVMCAIEIKFWHNASFNIEEESRLRERLGEDEQAHKFFIYMARKPSWWKEFKINLKEFAEKLGEKTFLDSQKTQALVTRISP